MSYCHECGSELPGGPIGFCPVCGASVGALSAGPGQPGTQAPRPSRRKSTLLIVAAVVLAFIVGLAILAVTAIPTFQGQRQKAQDAQAKSLVRNAMTAVEFAYVDLRTFAPGVMTPEELLEIEPTITWTALEDMPSVTARDLPDTCLAADNEVGYFGTETTYAVGSESESGTTFAVVVDKGLGGQNSFLIDGVTVDYW